MASGVVLQVDQAASADQGVFRDIGERGQNPSVDRHLGLCPGRYRQKTPEIRSLALHNSTDFEFGAIREKHIDSVTYRSSSCIRGTRSG